MDFELLTIADCPNDAPAETLFAQALALEGFDAAALSVREVRNDAEAAALRFHGSPSFTANGVDLFPTDAEPAVSCRVYAVSGGLAGTPELESLRSAIKTAAAL